MRSREREQSKIELNMTPMIDVVFQLLIFFMFTLKPIINEEQFAVNMATQGVAPPDEQMINLPPLEVHLKADANGELDAILLGNNELRSFDELRVQAQQLGGGALGDDIEAEIHADDALQYAHLISAVNALTAANITKINFASD